MSINSMTDSVSNIPEGMMVSDNRNVITFWGVMASSYKFCCMLKDPENWVEHNNVRDLWLQQASPKELFKFYKWDYKDVLSTPINKEEIEKNALEYIWSVNPELQSKYPNFEGITKTTEAERLWHNIPFQTPGTPWIHLSLDWGTTEWSLQIYTRESDTEDYVRHLYSVNEDWTVTYKKSQTQWEIQIAQLSSNVSNNVGLGIGMVGRVAMKWAKILEKFQR